MTPRGFFDCLDVAAAEQSQAQAVEFEPVGDQSTDAGREAEVAAFVNRPASATIEAGPVNIHSYDSVMRGRTSENEERLDGLHGWVIDGRTGRARSDMSRDTPLPVRLVRPRD